MNQRIHEKSPVRNRASDSGPILSYFCLLTLLVYLAAPENLVDIPTTYILKNRLHATANEIAIFRLITGASLYGAFVFGIARDYSSQFRMLDRGFLLVFGPVTGVVFAILALSHVSYATLLVAITIAMLSFRFILASYHALMARVGQERLISGRLSAAWSFFSSLPTILAIFASGWISEYLSPAETFSLAAVLCASIGLFGLWRPLSIFQQSSVRRLVTVTHHSGRVRDVLTNRGIYLSLCINFLWYFAPGLNTPTQFYLTNRLHAPDAVYAYFLATFFTSFLPAFFLYGYLATRVSLERLLWWGTIVAIPNFIPLLLIHSSSQAILVAIPMGLLAGVAQTSYYDLALRSSGAQLRGTTMMLVFSVGQLAQRGGDVVGAALYSSSADHGFAYCVAAVTISAGLILPCIKMIPRNLIATADGQSIAAAATS